MREIKFRAYDKIFKKVFRVESIDFDNNFIMMSCDGISSTSSSFNNCILEQFTGLKDKNGVEIYDGDILQYDNEIKIKGIVKWIDDEALFSIHYESGKYGLFAGEDMSLFEIIGNVHEEETNDVD